MDLAEDWFGEEYPMVVTREALYTEVWADPMLKVAERYEVSSSYMARVCTVMNVPRPAAGYCGQGSGGQNPSGSTASHCATD